MWDTLHNWIITKKDYKNLKSLEKELKFNFGNKKRYNIKSI